MALPALEWSFDEASGVAVDSSGNGRDLTISGNTTRTADGGGHTGKGLTQIAAATAAGPPLTGLQTTARTAMFWVRINASGNMWVMEFHRATEDTGVWGLLFLSGSLNWRAKDGSNVVYASPGIPPDLGVWHHIAATHDGANLKVYRDGTLFSTTAMPTAVWAADDMRVLDGTGTAVIIDDVRYFTSALTQAEIASFMAAPAGAAPTNVGTLSGSFSAPVASIAATATAKVTVEGTFAVPLLAGAGAASAGGALSGSFAAPVAQIVGTSTPPVDGSVAGAFASPSATFSVRSSADVSMIGTFSIPVFTGSGGVPMPDRDILVTIRPGDGSTTSIAAGPPRTSVVAGDFRRTEIGA